MKSKNLHKDHRQRVRARYLQDGVQSMPDHNILELLLFFGIPYKDTNNIAHELIEQFGSLNGVFDASVAELHRVDGIGENTAVLISLIKDIITIYNSRDSKMNSDTSEQDAIEEYIRRKYAGETRECVYMLSVDSSGKIQRCVKICEGSPDSAFLTARMVVETAVNFNSQNVILAHNHPNGFAVPSMADVTATTEFCKILSSIGINLADHIIVSGDDQFSMAKSSKYKSLFGQI